MTHTKFHFSWLMLTLLFGIWASEPPRAWRMTEKAGPDRVKRVKGSTVKQKLPITLDILLGIHKIINLNISYNASFWTVCLTAFLAILGNLICFLYPTNSMAPINSFLGLVFKFFTGEHLFRLPGAKLFSLERDQFALLSLVFPVHCFALSPVFCMLCLLPRCHYHAFPCFRLF